MIYLDNSATTVPDPEVVASYQKATEHYFANPSSIHQLGGTSEKLLQRAREQVAKLLDAETEEIVFTSGGTEGNNLAIKGIAFEHQTRGKHIITSAVEHPSIDETCESLKKFGFDITVLPVNEDGVVSAEDVEKSIREDTILISLMHVNNEIGSIQPIEEIGEIAKKHPKLFFHVDGVQALGKVPLQIKQSGIDLCTFSGHKIHGLKGTGILFIRKNTSIYPLLHGGGQENGLRSGTENLAGAAAMTKALRLIKEKERNNKNHLAELNHYLRTELNKIENLRINSPEKGAPHIINFSCPGVRPEVIIHMLGEREIYISTKSACSSKLKDESKVLAACGLPTEIAVSGLRVSLSYQNTIEELSEFIQVLKFSLNQFKKVMR